MCFTVRATASALMRLRNTGQHGVCYAESVRYQGVVPQPRYSDSGHVVLVSIMVILYGTQFSCYSW